MNSKYNHLPLKQISEIEKIQLNSFVIFPQCWYHKKPIKSLCISTLCQNPHYGMCEESECLTMHSHPQIQLIKIDQFNRIFQQNNASLHLLRIKMSQYYEKVKINIVHMIDKHIKMADKVMQYVHTHEIVRAISKADYQHITSALLQKFVNQNIHEQPTQRTKMEIFKTKMLKSIDKMEQNLSKIENSIEYQEIMLSNLYDKQFHKLQKNKRKITKFKSIILEQKQQFQWINSVLQQHHIPITSEPTLIHRASECQFMASKFRLNIEGYYPSILLVKTSAGRKFGAFINRKYGQSEQKQQWLGDASGMSFIFSLDHRQIYPLKQQDRYKNKVLYNGNIGPQIGAGCDIYISDGCHMNRASGCNIGGSFQLPFYLQQNTKKTRCHLAGQQNFYVNDYQIFHIQ